MWLEPKIIKIKGNRTGEVNSLPSAPLDLCSSPAKTYYHPLIQR